MYIKSVLVKNKDSLEQMTKSLLREFPKWESQNCKSRRKFILTNTLPDWWWNLEWFGHEDRPHKARIWTRTQMSSLWIHSLFPSTTLPVALWLTVSLWAVTATNSGVSDQVQYWPNNEWDYFTNDHMRIYLWRVWRNRKRTADNN